MRCLKDKPETCGAQLISLTFADGEHVSTLVAIASFIGHIQQPDQLQKGALTSTRGTDDHNVFTGMDF